MANSIGYRPADQGRPGTTDPNYMRRQALSQQLIGQSIQAKPAYSWGEALARALTPVAQTWGAKDDQNTAMKRDKSFQSDYGAAVKQWSDAGADPQALSQILSGSTNPDLAALAPGQVIQDAAWKRDQNARNEDRTWRTAESDKDRAIRQQQHEDQMRMSRLAADRAGAGTWSEPRLLTGQDGKPVLVQFNNRGGHRVLDGLQPVPDGPPKPENPIFQDEPQEGDKIQKKVSYDGGRTFQPFGVPYDRRDPVINTNVQGPDGSTFQVAIPRQAIVSASQQQQAPQQAVPGSDAQMPQQQEPLNGIPPSPNLPPNLPQGSVVLGGGARMREVPGPMATAMMENANAIRKIDGALSALSSSPDAVGLDKGFVNWAAPSLLDRWDSTGTNARALIADIGSLKIHDRSGAAVTAAEFPRLRPFIPQVGDNAATARKKLQLFRKEYSDILSDQYETYSPKQGYRDSPAIGKVIKSGSTGGTAEPDWIVEGGAVVRNPRKGAQ